jgi:hypothetical protein
MVYEDGQKDEQVQSSEPVDIEQKYADSEDGEEVKEGEQASRAWTSRLRSRQPRGIDSSSSWQPKPRKVKRKKGKQQEVITVKYLVKWKGYGEEEATWQRADELQHCQQAIDEYENGVAQQQSSDDPLALQSMYVWREGDAGAMDVVISVVA